MSQAPEALRRKAQAHYDRYPFGLAQAEILEEKLQNRVMGEAIRELASADAVVVDIGCGACRVAQMVRRVSSARTIGVDLSLQSLLSARTCDPGPLVNGDNLDLPLRSECADLVISNGVIHHTPDARASFMELARITKPAGTLVVSVYNRHSWYYYTYRYIGAVVRLLRRVIGDRGLRVTLLPPFHVALVILLSITTRRWFVPPIETSWNLFHDQFTTPQCTFHRFEEVRRWGEEAELICLEERKEAANQLASLRLKKLAKA